MKRLEKALKFPKLTPEFIEKLERRRAIHLRKYRLINDLLEKSTKFEAKMVENLVTKVLYKCFGWLVIKDQSL